MRLSAPIYQLKRRAKLLARDQNIPLHQAQARIAADEGFTAWSLLAAHASRYADAGALLPQLSNGDLLLIAARPGHGKTRLGLRLLLDAALEGRRSVLFSLEYTEREVMDRFRDLADPLPEATPEVVTTDDICAAYITNHLAGSPKGTVAVIDYLQILDQRRTTPPLSEQVEVLQTFAQDTGVILAVISQVDRSYEPEAASVPDISNLRLPNPIPLGAFSKACFLNAGEVHFQRLI